MSTRGLLTTELLALANKLQRGRTDREPLSPDELAEAAGMLLELAAVCGQMSDFDVFTFSGLARAAFLRTQRPRERL